MDEEHSGINRAEIIAVCLALLLGVGLVIWLLMQQQKSITPTQTTKPPQPPSKVQLALFANGLPKPTSIVSTKQASDKRLFVLGQDGLIQIVNADGTVVNEPFLDLSATVLPGAETGLLGLAFSPNYATDGFFFVNYVDKSLTTVVARYHISADSNKADKASAQIVLTQKQPYPNHKGGALAFGADGYLYIALGDGGSGGDPENRAQDLATWLGKILRLDVSQLPYRIPADNPFATRAGAKPEVWDYGLRNPWRISFDRQTQELYIADVGQGLIEEVNVEAAKKGGNNYGWRCFEGNKDFKADGCKAREQYVFPVLDYDHSQNRCSITGGYVYRGEKYPGLAGKYFYGDYCSGQLYQMAKQNNQWKATLIADTPYKISTFGEDSTGELYMADFATGSIYRLQAFAEQ
jgi:glucose/arabinose dehydrogenase